MENEKLTFNNCHELENKTLHLHIQKLRKDFFETSDVPIAKYSAKKSPLKDLVCDFNGEEIYVECKSDTKIRRTDNFCFEILSNVPRINLMRATDDSLQAIYTPGTKKHNALLRYFVKNHAAYPALLTDNQNLMFLHILSYMDVITKHNYFFDIRELKKGIINSGKIVNLDFAIALDNDSTNVCLCVLLHKGIAQDYFLKSYTEWRIKYV